MIVCVCKAVSDRQIRHAVKDGASSIRDLSRELGIGSCCGKCLPEARKALASCQAACASNSVPASGMLVPALG
jgi:bacterioferritin-associated ferredoxin